MVRKVLVQWLPTLPLRSVLALERGAKGSNEVQQWPLAFTEPLFVDFFARVNRWVEGSPVVQIGFDAHLIPSETGWKLGGGTIGPDAYFAERPTLEALLERDRTINPHRNPLPMVLDAIRENVLAFAAKEAETVLQSAAEYRETLKAMDEHPGEIQTVLVKKTREPEVEKAMLYADLPAPKDPAA